MQLGIDVTSVARIDELLQRQPRFRTRVFTEREQRRCGAKPERYASRWAAKEAVRKLYGSSGLRIPGYREIEVVNRRGGAPIVMVAGAPTEIAVSLTHDAGVAVAVVAGRPGAVVTSLPETLRLPDRPDDAHKGVFGTVVVVGGAVGYSGAPVMAATAALRSGAGRVRVCVPEPVYAIAAAHCLEAMVHPLESAAGGISDAALPALLERHGSQVDSWVLGPGMGREAPTERFLLALLEAIDVPAVVDADGLNIPAAHGFDWSRVHAPLVLTPHPAEMGRLLGIPTAEVQADRRRVAQEFAARCGVTVVLKGSETVVAAADGRCHLGADRIVALATGGSGDVLSGIIAAMLAQHLDPFDAAVAGVSLHTTAARTVQERLGRAGALPRDVLDELPRAQEQIRRILEWRSR